MAGAPMAAARVSASGRVIAASSSFAAATG